MNKYWMTYKEPQRNLPGEDFSDRLAQIGQTPAPEQESLTRERFTKLRKFTQTTLTILKTPYHRLPKTSKI